MFRFSSCKPGDPPTSHEGSSSSEVEPTPSPGPSLGKTDTNTSPDVPRDSGTATAQIGN